MNIIPVIIGIALLIGYAELLYSIPQGTRRKNMKLKFFGLLALPSIIMAIIFYPTYYVFATNNLLLSLLIASAYLAYTIGWSYTLYKVAGEQKRRWFYTILIINVMFLFYLFVEDE